MSSETITYPSQYETEVLLKDGSRLRLRPIRKEDVEAWVTFVNNLSTQTKYFRFHHVPKEFGVEDALRFCTVDYKDTFAIAAEVFRQCRWDIVAIGRYYRLPSRRAAEVAFVVGDAYQGKGVGTKLVEWLAVIARDNGIAAFEADVLPDNREMLQVFKDYGFHVTSELDTGVYRITFPIAPTKRVTRKEEERESYSTLASMRSLLLPHTVALIGASRHTGTIGHLIFKALLDSEFSGIVYPVNPNTESVLSVKSYPSVLDIPGNIDLAVIAVPAPLVIRVADECGRKGVRAVIVISDGFGERGPEGAALEAELRQVTLGYGMRMLGPNCMGVLNTDPAVSLNATFSPVFPAQGNVAFLSQSGALGLAILDYAEELNIGMSSFISVGNRVDISSNDLLQFWEQDPATKVILLYLESFGNPNKFGRIARRVSAVKPIVAMKAGRTSAGSRAALSHTGSMATTEVGSEALFRKAGMIRVDTLEELFDVATFLSNQPVPGGRNVVIVTNGGGPGILAADACEQNGLNLPAFSPETTEKLKTVIKREVGLRNPLDLTAGATAGEFENTLKVLANDNAYDAVITIFIPPVVVGVEDTAHAISRVARLFQRRRKPLLTCFMGERGFKTRLGTEGSYVPSYPFPEAAVSALTRAVKYGEWQKKPKGNIPRIYGLRRTRAEKLIETAMSRSARRPLWLSDDEITELLDCYGISFLQTRIATTASDAARISAELGFPVAVKLASSTILHKTDVGGVALYIKSEDEVVRTFNTIKSRLAKLGRAAEMDGVKIQHMVEEGIEAIAGVTQDPSFGPLIMFGTGGIYAELLKDVAIGLHPLTDLDAEELVSSIKLAKMFQGYRGSPPSDVGALKNMLLRLSELIEDIPQIAELDFNPIKVLPVGEGYRVLDARIMVK